MREASPAPWLPAGVIGTFGVPTSGVGRDALIAVRCKATGRVDIVKASSVRIRTRMDNSPATDAITEAPVTLNLTDPDSLSTDGKGDLVLVSHGDSEIITIAGWTPPVPALEAPLSGPALSLVNPPSDTA